jgi:predicted transcriptional regulator of viral defense system
MNYAPDNARALRPVIGAELRARGLDAAIAALAQRQHGVVSRDQLAGLGLGRRAIGHRLECGRLHVIHRGVFAVGHQVLSREGHWIAAVLAVGPGAALSHRSAAALWGMRETARGRVDVTVARRIRSRSAIQAHLAEIAADELTAARGILVTTPARTLLDLAAVVGPRALERAIDEAEMLRLTSVLSLADLTGRYSGRPGAPAIRRILDAGRVGATITRSDLENRFLALLDDVGLPRPDVNARVEIAGGWVEADCVWHAGGLVVELDGYASHGTRSAFERDRARDRALQVAGWRVVRITWRQLHERPDAVASELSMLLSAPARS